MSRLLERKLKLCFTEDGRLEKASNKDANLEVRPGPKSFLTKVDILKPKSKRQEHLFRSLQVPPGMETCGDEAFKTAAESNALPSIALIKSDQ